MEYCINQVSSSQCIKCEEGYLLYKGKCVYGGGCSLLTNTSCNCSDSITVGAPCDGTVSGCKYSQIISTEKKSCITCTDNFNNSNSECLTTAPNVLLLRNNHPFKCADGYYAVNSNCIDCGHGGVCQYHRGRVYYMSCDTVLNVTTSECASDSLCSTYSNSRCSKCKEDTMYIQEGVCHHCSDKHPHCIRCTNERCHWCEVGFVLINNRCISNEEQLCQVSDGRRCTRCMEGSHLSNVTHQCLSNTGDCIYAQSANQSHQVCAECTNGYLLTGETCTSPSLKADKLNGDICMLNTPKGCIRCADGYYLDSTGCVKCSNDCLTCLNQTYCLSCDVSVHYLTARKTCEDNNGISEKCYRTIPASKQCAICKSSYYRQDSDCIQCHTSCETCQNSNSCVTCNAEYYMIESESPLCQPFETLTNCILKTDIGCKECSNGYYLTLGRCHKCPQACSSCTPSVCTNCIDGFVLIDSECIPFDEVEYCTRATNGECTKCSGWHKPADDGTSCEFAVNYGVVIGIPLALIFLFILLVIALVLLIVWLRQKKKEEEKLKNICFFKMSRSNITMDVLGDSLLSNKKVLTFDGELIPVNEESRDLICIGNRTDHHLKVQFSVKQGCDQYTIKTEPQLITLKKGEACEFEIFITPLCSCTLKDELIVTSLDVEKGILTTTPIGLSVETTLTTRLDYRELKEDEKLGEGSFGIVYRGTFRGHQVAIKKMKESNNTDAAKKEFEDEIIMLDKFRSDYIIHFYGAVFIPGKICIVTEYASYGSLNNLINRRRDDPVSKDVRVKILLDAARGIDYLHENNILHRDIKPDNILVTSLELDQSVNGKLTDFGSSRNINMLMTNMTFTKGVGTPKYMAPEVLNKGKYTKSADVYSFSITMYETMKWDDPFPKTVFPHPWDVANLITQGKRPSLDVIDMDMHKVITDSWTQDPKERCTMKKLVDTLSSM